MAPDKGAPALVFRDTAFELITLDGQPWLRGGQVGEALGYSKDSKIIDLFNRYGDEFTDSMTALVKLPTAGGIQEVRIFSLRGAHLLGMFARTARAAEFRRWVLDVLDHQLTDPTEVAAPALVDTKTVAATLERVIAERDALRTMLAERFLKENPVYRRVMYYYGVEGLTHLERAKLMGWKTSTTYTDALKKLATLGLVDYAPDPKLSANGRANFQKMRQTQAAAGLRPALPAPRKPVHPSRERPTLGRSPQEMEAMRNSRKPKAGSKA